MPTEFEIVSFLNTHLAKTLGDQFNIVAQPRVSTSHGSYVPDILVTDVSSGARYVIEVKGTTAPSVTSATLDFPLATEASVRRTRESLPSQDEYFVLVTPLHISPTQKRALEKSKITVINSDRPSEVLEKLVDVISTGHAPEK
jgi:hypothetical protein